MNSLDRRSLLFCLGGAVAAGTLALAPTRARAIPLASGGLSIRTDGESLIEEARSRRVCRWHRGRQICHWQRWTCWWHRGRRICGWR